MTALLDQLDLTDAIVVGQDWGGPIGFLAAAARPERVSGLVILNTVVSEPKPGFKATAFHRFARLPLLSGLVFRVIGAPPVGMGLAQGDRTSIRGAVSRAYRWPLRRRQDRAAPLAMARMVPNSQKHPSIAPLRRCRKYLESFDGPIEVVWGDRDPVLGSVVRWIAKLLPAANIVHTEGGHFLQEEVPGPIAAAIRRVAAGKRQATSAPA
jgi:haloalkane dehalogenase